MAKKQFEQYLSRRMMGETGWVYFCRTCGLYLPEEQFYKSKDSKWGLDSRCKIHHSRRDPDDDGEMAYLKLNPITEQDFIDTQVLLEKLGYFFTGETIHTQFKKRHNI